MSVNRTTTANRRLDYTLARRAGLLVSVIGAIICVVLLLNITAPNPTGRRYSSETVITTGTPATIGYDGERVLARDLGVPNNNASGQLQCICNSQYLTTPSRCNVCTFWVPFPNASQFAIPDFVGKKLIADSKNVAKLDWTGDVPRQIELYAATAAQYDLELWVFVRVDTEVDPRYKDLIEPTGGGIVRYFDVPGHTDPIDRTATTGLLICAPLSIVLLALEVHPAWFRRPRRAAPRLPAPVAPAPANKVEEAELFRDTLRSKARRRMDREDAKRDV